MEKSTFPLCKDCIYCIELYKHPWNKKKFLKGTILDSTHLYACVLPMDLNMNSDSRGILFDNNNGSCEMHTSNKNYKLKVYGE